MELIKSTKKQQADLNEIYTKQVVMNRLTGKADTFNNLALDGYTAFSYLQKDYTWEKLGEGLAYKLDNLFNEEDFYIYAIVACCLTTFEDEKDIDIYYENEINIYKKFLNSSIKIPNTTAKRKYGVLKRLVKIAANILDDDCSIECGEEKFDYGLMEFPIGNCHSFYVIKSKQDISKTPFSLNDLL